MDEEKREGRSADSGEQEVKETEEKEVTKPTKKVFIAAPGLDCSFSEMNKEIELLFDILFKHSKSTNWILVKPNHYFSYTSDDKIRKKKLINIANMVKVISEVDAVCFAPRFIFYDDFLIVKRMCDSFDIPVYIPIRKSDKLDGIDLIIIPEDMNKVGNIAEILSRAKSYYTIGDPGPLSIIIDNINERAWFATPHALEGDEHFRKGATFNNCIVKSGFDIEEDNFDYLDLYIEKTKGTYHVDRFARNDDDNQSQTSNYDDK